MISVQEVVTDPDMIAPKPYTILRSVGVFVLGGFQSTTTSISMFGPVQQASNKEIDMLPEGDRVGSVRSFWSVARLYTTRGTASVPGTHGEVPEGSNLVYNISELPPQGAILLYSNGLQLTPGIDYTLSGTTITLVIPYTKLYATWDVTVQAGQAASDILVYETEQYRVIQTYFDPGGGYWKALAKRMAAA